MILLLQILKHFSIAITIINSKIFSDDVYSFDSYGVSVGFGFDNSKALMMIVLIALKMVLLNLETIVKVCVWEPPYTTAPPCNAWGNAPVDDS